VRSIAALAIAVGTLAGCSGAAPATRPSPSASPTSTPEIVHEFVGEAPLEPGRTRYSAFEPAFTFVVPEGWAGGHEHPDYFDVWNGADLSVGFGRPIGIPGPDGRVDAGSLTPREVLQAIARIVADPSPISETEIDGRPAVEMSFSVDHRTGVLRFGAGTLHIEPPWRAQAFALEVGGARFVILVQTTVPGEDALDTPVPATVEFGADPTDP
jgi:hypothetical protein